MSAAEELQAWLSKAGERVTLLPRAADAVVHGEAGTMLHAATSTFGALTLDHGWIRVLGGGAEGVLGVGHFPAGAPLVAGVVTIGFDVLGGLFGWNAGGLGKGSDIHYFAPDTLRWEPLDLNYAGWLGWLLLHRTRVDQFYRELRWPGWETEVGPLAFEHGLHLHPPLWSKEGRDPSRASRRAIPVGELFDLGLDVARRLDG